MASPIPRPAPAAPTRAPSVSLANVKSGKLDRPMRVLLYGVEGIGKSTFGASAPKPVFLGAEEGTAQLDVDRLMPEGRPMDWQDAKDFVHALASQEHGWKTLVIDTADWLEPMLWDHIVKRDGEKSIESYGYGKGYVAALDEWRVFLDLLERVRLGGGMHVVLLAHSSIKKFQNPQGEDFDRYELKLNAKAAALLKEWSDCVLFANYETHAQKDAKTKRVRAWDTGARLIYTQRRAAYDAKNRFGLPEALSLSWQEFEAAVRAERPGDPAELKLSAEEKIPRLPADLQDKAREYLAAAGLDAIKLSKLNDWLNAKEMTA